MPPFWQLPISAREEVRGRMPRTAGYKPALPKSVFVCVIRGSPKKSGPREILGARPIQDRPQAGGYSRLEFLTQGDVPETITDRVERCIVVVVERS
jgi:hypothetical protein